MRLHPAAQLAGSVCKMRSHQNFSTQLVALHHEAHTNNSLVYYGNKSAVGGDVALSAMGIVMKLAMILASVCIGIGIGSPDVWI